MKLKIQLLILFVLSVSSGLARQYFPLGISWTGQWPTDQTSAYEAFRMLAKDGDPYFVSLDETRTIQKEKSGFILDARSSQLFSEGRIPNSRNLPFYEIDQFQEAALDGVGARDKIVIYCEGIGCELSFFLGRELMQAGFEDVGIFYGGYPEWVNAGYPIEPNSQGSTNFQLNK